MNKIILHIDGGCSGNKQKNYHKRSIISVVTDINGNVLIEKTEKGGSNNIAEFIALKEAVKYCVNHKIKQVEIITDSQNNINWLKRLKKKKQNNYELVAEIREEIVELSKFVDVDLIWKPREENIAGRYIENKYNL